MRICNNHDGIIVPILSTFAFMGAEYWCPHCGANYGFFNGCEKVEDTPEMIATMKKYKELSREFLDAKSTQACDSLMHEGKRISPEDLPDEIKQKNEQTIKDWKYGQTV